MPPRLALFRPAALNFLTVRSGLLVCALFLAVGLDLAGDYGFVYNEPIQRRMAAANLDYILGQGDSLDQLDYPLAVYGMVFELPLLLAERALALEDYHYIHRLRFTLTHLFFIIGGFFCYRLAYHLFGSRLIALFALLFYLLHPRIYAHSFLNSKDLPFLSMFVIALYLLERAFRRDTLGAYALLGLAVGLLINLRIMGVMLLCAVVAMRGLDLFYARSGTERKDILLTGGLFLLAAGLTLYAVTPYAWANPVDYLATSLNLTVNHPVLKSELFQGRWIPSDQMPPHYAVTWFSIATPPLLLLLGGIGAAIAAARGLRRRRAIFRNARLRFALLLLACCLLPPAVAALLGSNQYGGWRHLYFLYVPFCLLAAGGLGGLAAALSRRRRWRAGVYGLAGAGLGLILLQMAQIHPLQHSYFSLLVDRTTPDYLRTQYEMDYWFLSPRSGLAALLQRHPGETLTVQVDNNWDVDIMPPAARARLRRTGGGRNADYELTKNMDDPARPDLAFSPQYISLYANRLLALRPLQASRMTAAAVAAYRELYRQAVAGEPIIRADYDVYLENNRLTFVREDCPPDSRDAWFAARSYPPGRVAAADAPPEAFGNHGVRLGDICLGVLQLPDYIRGDVVISQSDMGKLRPAGLVWAELYSLSPPGLREHIARLRQESSPTPPNAFAVFLDQDAAAGYRLLYAKETCAQAEYEAPVFLQIIPDNLGDLPFYRWGSGFDNRELRLSRYGIYSVKSGGECLAVVPLPEYPVTSILTGQAGAWETRRYTLADPEMLRAAYAALSDRQPDARADFDLYLRDNRLTYARESCAATDTAAGFLLHIIPRDTADLPQDRRRDGYANWDFDFARWGGSFDGKCLATVPLPDYPIAALRTGQSGIWEVNLYPPADPESLRAAYAALSDRQTDARADFALYLQDNRLIYLRETCAAADTAAGFFLHIIPVDLADLPAERQAAGFANLDFDFARYGGAFDGKCLATVPLPEYPIKSIRTGQYIPGQGELWAAELTVER